MTDEITLDEIAPDEIALDEAEAKVRIDKLEDWAETLGTFRDEDLSACEEGLAAPWAASDYLAEAASVGAKLTELLETAFQNYPLYCTGLAGGIDQMMAVFEEADDPATFRPPEALALGGGATQPPPAVDPTGFRPPVARALGGGATQPPSAVDLSGARNPAR